MKTVELKPDWAKGYSRLGGAHFGLKNFAEAVEAYNKGLELDPTNGPCRTGLQDAEAARAGPQRAFLGVSQTRQYPCFDPMPSRLALF